MNLAKTSSLFAMMVFLSACVTINIYFPAAQAEEAIQGIVDDILSKERQESKADDKQSARELPLYVQIGTEILDFLVPAAHAAEPDFNVKTPEIRKIQAKMKQRTPSLKPFYSSGAVGFTNDALVTIRDIKKVPLKDRAKIKKLVTAENKDREDLFSEIAKANGNPQWKPKVRSTFLKTWMKRVESGWWYQDAKGNWKQK